MSCCTTATAGSWQSASAPQPLAPNSRASVSMSIPAAAFQRPPTGRHPITAPSVLSAEPRPDRLMRAIAVMTFTYVWRVQDAFPILGKLQFPLLALAAALVFYSSTRHPARRVSQIQQPTFKL